MEITSIKQHQQVVSTSTEIIKVKQNRRQKWKVRRKQEEDSDAGRQKHSEGNRMLSNQAHWNIHHPALLVFPSYLPFQSVLCPPVSQPLRQPDLLQFSRGFLKVPNACLAKDSFSHLFLGLLDGWSRVWTSLPHPPPPSVLCVKRRRVMFVTGRCFPSPMRQKTAGGAVGRERFGSTPDLSARHYQEVHWPASPPIAHSSVYVSLTIYDLFYTPRAHAHFLSILYESIRFTLGILNAFNLLT